MEVDVMLKLDRYTGLADTYDTYRPCPPVVIPDMLIRLARIPRPRLVVDLGCGTGLSTFIWVDCAEAVVGIVALKGQHRRGMVHADCDV